MLLSINEEEKVVMVDDSDDGVSPEDCIGRLIKALPGGSCRYAIVDLGNKVRITLINTF